MTMNPNTSVDFFDQQFMRQVGAREFALNPFETAALPHLRGKVLDFGCGLGNLAIEAAKRGCRVTAMDASHAAIAHLQEVARRDALPIEAVEADLRNFELADRYDAIVCIGLLMFFACPTAYRQLLALQEHVRPGGVAVVNVLTEGTTYMDMFAPEEHCLFRKDDLRRRFAGWQVLHHDVDEFPVPGGTRKVFATAVARKPSETGAA
jgi:tellurite methyltransferase